MIERKRNLDKAGWIQLEGESAYVQYFDWNTDYTKSEQRQAIIPQNLVQDLLVELNIPGASMERLSGQRVLFSTDADFDQLVRDMAPLPPSSFSR